MKIGILVFSIAALLIGGCHAVPAVTTRSIAVSDDNPNRPVYENGEAILKSQKRHTVFVRLITQRYSKDLNNLPTFLVALVNGSDQPLDFSPGNITASSGQRIVKVFNFEDMQKFIRKDANAAAVLGILTGLSQSLAAAAPQRSYTSGVAVMSGSGGNAAGAFVGNTVTYNPAATALAQTQINANTQRQLQAIAAVRNDQLSSLGTMLRRNTVMPGMAVAGTIRLQPKAMSTVNPLTLKVLIDGEEHEFTFVVGQ